MRKAQHLRGRTNATQLYHRVYPGGQIHYVDYTSLYPYIIKYKRYPVVHPKIHLQVDPANLSQYFGLVKCKILRPTGCTILCCRTIRENCPSLSPCDITLARTPKTNVPQRGLGARRAIRPLIWIIPSSTCTVWHFPNPPRICSPTTSNTTQDYGRLLRLSIPFGINSGNVPTRPWFTNSAIS